MPRNYFELMRAISDALASLTPEAEETRMAVTDAGDSIRERMAEGYTYERIAAALREHGIMVGADQLMSYVPPQA